MANKRITQLPTAPQVEDNDYIAIDNTSTPTAENDGGTRKILVKDITAKSADAIDYDNTTSGLEADNVQDAIDEVLEEGGKVQDVKVNGVSVLDNNKTAQIVSYKEVTQAQYDALPSSKLTDGIMYCIKDADFSAEDVPYDNSDSGLESEDVQSAVDEIADVLGALKVEGTVENAQIATFSDGSPLPMPKLEIAVEPQQDLHGYDAPWVGGAGKNKLAMDISDIKSLNTTGTWNGNTYTINGAEYKINIDTAGNITSINARSVASNPNGDLKIATTISADSYILSSGFTETNGVNDTFLQKDGVTIARGNNSSPGTNFTITESSEVVLHIRLSRNDSSFICTPMIRLSTETDATFAPYSNECPISGWSAVDVSVSGVNITDEIYESGIYNITTGEAQYNASSIRGKNPAMVKPNTSYYSNNIYLRILYFDKNNNYLSQYKVGDGEFTTPANCYWIRWYLADVYGTTYNHDISINYPSTDTEYHAYNGQTITIQLGDTYYGCKLDVVSGVLTVTHKSLNLGDQTWETVDSSGGVNRFYVELNDMKSMAIRSMDILCSCYKTNVGGGVFDDSTIYNTPTPTRIMINTSQYSDAMALKNSLSGQTAVYELATPLTIQLTPTQVSSLMGVNNIFADCGKINKAVYIRDLNIVINNLINA